eukprot:15467311-Alexandrium_andersonii.AAC.1
MSLPPSCGSPRHRHERAADMPLAHSALHTPQLTQRVGNGTHRGTRELHASSLCAARFVAT